MTAAKRCKVFGVRDICEIFTHAISYSTYNLNVLKVCDVPHVCENIYVCDVPDGIDLCDGGNVNDAYESIICLMPVMSAMPARP